MKTKYSSRITVCTLLLICLAGWSTRATADAWGTNCAACHGKDGKGATMMGRKLGIKDLSKASLTDAQITKVIKEGVTENGTEKMKAFADKLSADDIKALVAQVHSFK